ncbi:MAG: hypothetical protein FWE94_04870 [Coriobacteriia bacterium]|nr:hypothetical protein [Coriobacteriia bacterium]
MNRKVALVLIAIFAGGTLLFFAAPALSEITKVNLTRSATKVFGKEKAEQGRVPRLIEFDRTIRLFGLRAVAVLFCLVSLSVAIRELVLALR